MAFLVTATVAYCDGDQGTHSHVVRLAELLGYIASLTYGDARLVQLSVVPAPEAK